MDKEEILAKSRQENRNGDERDREIASRSALVGFVGMSAAYVVMLLLEVFLKGRTGYNLIVLFSVFLATSGVSRYRMSGSKIYLFAAACWILSAVVWFILYLWRG